MMPLPEPANITHWEQSLENRWLEDCRTVGVPLNDVQLGQFRQFYALLVEANRTTNLTRLTAPEDFLDRHLLDSLALAPLLPESTSAGALRLADIGSGAGFPAIPLALVRPDVSVTAVEATGKKCAFIESTKAALSLENLAVLNARGETMGQDVQYREQFDVVTARAVAALPALLELCLPLLRVGGVFLAMKGVSYEAELAASARALKTLGGAFREVRAFEPEALSASRVLIFKKTAPTPKPYPRNPGLPAKKPL